FAHAERAQACRGEGDLHDVVVSLAHAILIEVTNADGRQTPQPLPGGAHVADAQHHVAGALERVEGAPDDRLDIGDVDLEAYGGVQAHISATQRRSSSSLLTGLSWPLRRR